MRSLRQSFGAFRAWLVGVVGLELLAGLLAALGCLWVTLWIADEVLEGDSVVFDRSVRQWFQEQRSARLDVAMEEITALGGETVLAVFVLATIGLLVCLRRRQVLWFLVICVVGAAILNFSAKAWVGRTRPEGAGIVLDLHSPSFPSGHAMMSLTVYLTFALILAPLIPSKPGRVYLVAFAVLLAAAIGISRIYLGVHYPTDVAAGWLAGLFWAMSCWTGRAWVRRAIARRQAVRGDVPATLKQEAERE